MNRYDPRIFDLIPHRPPMLLINEIVTLEIDASSTLVFIDEQTPFFEEGKGVPSWVGLEYMGQTAALISGLCLEKGLIEPSLGFLLGTRSYSAKCEYFKPGVNLLVSSSEHPGATEDYARFDCVISSYDSEQKAASVPLVQANLSVYRRRLSMGSLE
jgi:predicted hotdog family 3-hydroxylacyl-ACP dehydratase